MTNKLSYTADEMRTLTETSIQDANNREFTEEYSAIMSIIKKAAVNRQYEAFVPLLSDSVRRRLEKDDFIIEKTSLFTKLTKKVKVSWRDIPQENTVILNKDHKPKDEPSVLSKVTEPTVSEHKKSEPEIVTSSVDTENEAEDEVSTVIYEGVERDAEMLF